MWWKSECYFRIKFNPFLTSTSHVVMFNVFGFSAKSEKRCCSESEMTGCRRRAGLRAGPRHSSKKGGRSESSPILSYFFGMPNSMAQYDL